MGGPVQQTMRVSAFKDVAMRLAGISEAQC